MISIFKLVQYSCTCLIVFSLLITAATGQEKLRIDNETVAVVPSPWKLMDVESKASLRGLHVVSANEIWASGTGGTIINSKDGGESWRVSIVPGAENLDFRDIHAIDDGTIVAITSGTPARIYRSTDGGSRWKVCYENVDEKYFLDALSFWDDRFGMVMGDPVDGELLLLGTGDTGKTWKPFPKIPLTLAGEAGFAASGTNMIAMNRQKILIALGGDEEGQSKETSRLVISEDRGKTWAAAVVPLRRSPSAGIFSICFANDKDGIAVGGDYLKADSVVSNYATTRDGGRTWTTPNPRQPPSGYRSCVAVWMKGREINFVTVGPSGTDLSSDLGSKWHRVSNEGFHAVDFTEDGLHGWATGGDGRIARWIGIQKTYPVEPSDSVTKGPIAEPTEIK